MNQINVVVFYINDVTRLCFTQASCKRNDECISILGKLCKCNINRTYKYNILYTFRNKSGGLEVLNNFINLKVACKLDFIDIYTHTRNMNLSMKKFFEKSEFGTFK